MKKSEIFEFIFLFSICLLLGVIGGFLLQQLFEGRINKNFCSCNDDYKEDQRIIVQDTADIKLINFDRKSKITIIVDRETDVEYMIIDGVMVQPLYNPDGSLRTRE